MIYLRISSVKMSQDRKMHFNPLTKPLIERSEKVFSKPVPYCSLQYLGTYDRAFFVTIQNIP